LVHAKDGLTGSWTKLTGANGVYNFTVNDPQGLYSIAVAEPEFGYRPKVFSFSTQSFQKQNLTGLNTILYTIIFGYYDSVDDFGSPEYDVQYLAYISSGYLAAIGNNYVVPKIGGDFAQFDIDTTKNILVGLPFYVASNKSVKELFIPTDGTKMLMFGFLF